MIDIQTETTLPTSSVPRHPAVRREPPLHHSTVQRWIRRGILGTNGERVKLEAIRLGGRWYTSVEALGRFGARLSNDAPEACTQTDTTRNAESANAALDRLGY